MMIRKNYQLPPSITGFSISKSNEKRNPSQTNRIPGEKRNYCVQKIKSTDYAIMSLVGKVQEAIESKMPLCGFLIQPKYLISLVMLYNKKHQKECEWGENLHLTKESPQRSDRPQ